MYARALRGVHWTTTSRPADLLLRGSGGRQTRQPHLLRPQPGYALRRRGRTGNKQQNPNRRNILFLILAQQEQHLPHARSAWIKNHALDGRAARASPADGLLRGAVRTWETGRRVLQRDEDLRILLQHRRQKEQQLGGGSRIILHRSLSTKRPLWEQVRDGAIFPHPLRALPLRAWIRLPWPMLCVDLHSCCGGRHTTSAGVAKKQGKNIRLAYTLKVASRLFFDVFPCFSSPPPNVCIGKLAFLSLSRLHVRSSALLSTRSFLLLGLASVYLPLFLKRAGRTGYLQSAVGILSGCRTPPLHLLSYFVGKSRTTKNRPKIFLHVRSSVQQQTFYLKAGRTANGNPIGSWLLLKLAVVHDLHISSETFDYPDFQKQSSPCPPQFLARAFAKRNVTFISRASKVLAATANKAVSTTQNPSSSRSS